MSNTPIKNGKKPLSSKPKKILTDADVFGDRGDIPADVKAELAAQGLTGRWLNTKVIADNGGYHPKGWVPYKRPKVNSDTMSSSEFRYGSDPEGYVRNGVSILGVKTSEKVDQHRALLAQKANRFKNIQKQKADELRQLSRDAGLDAMNIHEGFEENED